MTKRHPFQNAWEQNEEWNTKHPYYCHHCGAQFASVVEVEKHQQQEHGMK